MAEINFNQVNSQVSDESRRKKSESMAAIRAKFEAGDIDGGMEAMRLHIQARAEELREEEAEALAARKSTR